MGQSGKRRTKEWSEYTRLIVGIITIIPFVYMIAFIIFILIPYGVSVYTNSYVIARRIDSKFLSLYVAHISIIIYCFILYFYYLHHVKRNNALSDAEKKAWLALLRHLGLFAMPIYWYRYYNNKCGR